ncbi:MAG: 50S ribosomal protein L13 [Planctomycetota bacterium]|nr:MAG: 50S ribosomal protein L13 [Planctomycetota bacterium]
MTTKTYMAKTGEVQADWCLIDATDKVVGRLSAEVAVILQGKNKPEYTPHVDTGDFVVIVNAEKVKLTGANKPTQRVYKNYSGYPGGLKLTTLDDMLVKKPEQVLRESIRRMLPKTRLGIAMLTKLKIYAGPEHPHQAQTPKPLELCTSGT